jgi:hypothetical protein
MPVTDQLAELVPENRAGRHSRQGEHDPEENNDAQKDPDQLVHPRFHLMKEFDETWHF